MKTNSFFRTLTITAAALTAVGFSQTAFAENAAASTTGVCYINVQNGHPVPRSDIGPFGSTPDSDGNHASIPGQATYFRGSDGSWSNSATGTHVPDSDLGPFGSTPDSDGNHASIPGQATYVRIPCPPPAPPVTANPPPEPPKVSSVSSGWTGGYLGGELVKNSWHNRSTETSAATGAITNQFTDSGDPLGGGITGGFNFKSGNIVIGPFASIDFLHQTMNHNFGGGAYLGTTTHRIFTLGAKVGVETMPGLLVYGIGGVSWLNEDMNINFGGPVTSQNTTVRGYTLGPGIEYQPTSWQQSGMPVSLFVQYQHSWWQDAKLNTPVASPLFNYAFKHTDDTIRFGINVYFP